MLDLSGTWSLADERGEYDLPAAVPGDAHSALLAAGLIPDPYHGRNEYALRWVADRDWTLSRSFEDGEGARLLVLDGLDPGTEVRLNDAPVVTADSAFREYTAEVETNVGVNRIELVLRSNTRLANALQAEQPFPVPYHAGNSPIPNGNMLRRPQADFGWDRGIALAPVGVAGAIRLIGPGGDIGDALIRQRHSEGAALVEIEVWLRHVDAAEIDWQVALGGVQSAGRLALADGSACICATLTIPAPELWWPRGYGPQPIHELVVTAGGLTRRWPLALRDIHLVSEPDVAGRSLKLRVNGRDIFARGANWIPADALPGRITDAATRGLLESAVAANMNMIRVWGGGRYEPASFYEACDELSLLIWQDFMFACHLYPATEDFLAEVRREVAYQSRRLAHHVALWCGDNELLGALNWFEESRNNRDRYLVADDRLNRTIETALKATLPDANWWPSSPSPGPMSFGYTWHDDSSGDMHFWSVWHEGRDFEHYRDVRPRFCSEFGFQSYTSLPVIRSFADEADLNITSPVMESHQRNAGGNARIAETMLRYFRFPKDFPNFVWLSQVQQGIAIKTAVETWRSLKPHCMGTLYWQLNDTWPVASWSLLDYGGGWKLLHHMARRFFQSVHVAAIPTAENVCLMATNDTAAPVEITAEAFAVTLDGQARPPVPSGAIVGTEAAAALTEIPLAALAEGEILAFRWTAANGMAGGDVFAPVRWKHLALCDPKIRLGTTPAEGQAVARLAAEAVALFVTLEADRPGRFWINAIALFPGHDAEITFTPAEGDAAGIQLTVRDLYSSFANT